MGGGAWGTKRGAQETSGEGGKKVEQGPAKRVWSTRGGEMKKRGIGKKKEGRSNLKGEKGGGKQNEGVDTHLEKRGDWLATKKRNGTGGKERVGRGTLVACKLPKELGGWGISQPSGKGLNKNLPAIWRKSGGKAQRGKRGNVWRGTEEKVGCFAKTGGKNKR